MINPLGTAVMKLFPEPNLTGSLTNNYNFESADHHAALGQHGQGRLEHQRQQPGCPGGSRRMGEPRPAPTSTSPPETWRTPFIKRPAAGPRRGGHLHPYLLAHLRDGRPGCLELRSRGLDPGESEQALTKKATGLEGLPLAYTPTNDILPAMTFGTYPNFAFPRTPADSYTNEYQFSSNFTWSKGTHIIKFGILHIRNYKNEDDSSGPGAGNDKGTFDFSPNANSPFDTGYGPSNLLLGSLNSFTQTQFIAHKDAEYDDTDFYIQDTWKVKHNLTFDYGVRLYHMPSQHELDPSRTNDATFVPSLWTASQAVRLYVLDPTSPTQVIDPAHPNNPLPASLTNILKYTIVPGSGNPRDGVARFRHQRHREQWHPRSQGHSARAPRGGFAWSPDRSDKTVIRGGFGWGYNRPNIAQALNAFENGNAQQTDIVLTSLATLSAPSNVQPHRDSQPGGDRHLQPQSADDLRLQPVRASACCRAR